MPIHYNCTGANHREKQLEDLRQFGENSYKFWRRNGSKGPIHIMIMVISDDNDSDNDHHITN